MLRYRAGQASKVRWRRPNVGGTAKQQRKAALRAAA